MSIGIPQTNVERQLALTVVVTHIVEIFDLARLRESAPNRSATREQARAQLQIE
jgi:hypothetical protein